MRRRSEGATVAWDVARVLVVACAAALLVALWFALRPVENPGVQDCGAPLRYVATNERDVLVPVGTPDAPPDAPALRAQPPCSELVVVPLERAGLFTVVGISLGLVGAVLGLLDDRIALRRAPRFEDLVRPRPEDAPGRALDPVPTSIEDLGRDLPLVERTEVALLAGGWVAAAVGLVALSGVDPVRAALGRVSAADVVVVALLLGAGRAVAGGGRWLALGGGARPLSVPPAEPLEVAVAADWEARARPETGVAGLDVHHLVRGLDVPRATARARVGALGAVAVLVHLVVLLVAAAGGVPSVPEPDGREYVLLVGGVVVVLLVGLARVPGVLRAMALVPVPGDLRTALARDRWPATAAGALAAAVGIALEVAAVATLLGAAGVELPVRVVALAWLVAVTLGAASPFGGGAGLTEGVVVLLAWRWGAPVAPAVAGVLLWRLADSVAPLVSGWLAGRRLRAAGRL